MDQGCATWLFILLGFCVLRTLLDVYNLKYRVKELQRQIQIMRVPSPRILEPIEVTLRSGETPLRLFNVAGELNDLTLRNEDPGLQQLELVINGKRFETPLLARNDERSFDLSKALLAGGGNSMTLAGSGGPEGAATVVLSAEQLASSGRGLTTIDQEEEV